MSVQLFLIKKIKDFVIIVANGRTLGLWNRRYRRGMDPVSMAEFGDLVRKASISENVLRQNMLLYF